MAAYNRWTNWSNIDPIRVGKKPSRHGVMLKFYLDLFGLKNNSDTVWIEYNPRLFKVDKIGKTMI